MNRRRGRAGTRYRGGAWGDVGMRPRLWAFILIAVLTCAVTYQLTNWSSWPSQSPVVADESNPQPLDQKSDPPLTNKDEARLQEGGSSVAVLKSDELPVAQEQVPPQDAPANELPVARVPAPPEEPPSLVPSISLPRAKQNKISRGSPTTLMRKYPLRPNQRIRSSMLSRASRPERRSKKSGGWQTYCGWTSRS